LKKILKFKNKNYKRIKRTQKKKLIKKIMIIIKRKNYISKACPDDVH